MLLLITTNVFSNVDATLSVQAIYGKMNGRKPTNSYVGLYLVDVELSRKVSGIATTLL